MYKHFYSFSVDIDFLWITEMFLKYYTKYIIKKDLRLL